MRGLEVDVTPENRFCRARALPVALRSGQGRSARLEREVGVRGAFGGNGEFLGAVAIVRRDDFSLRGEGGIFHRAANDGGDHEAVFTGGSTAGRVVRGSEGKLACGVGFANERSGIGRAELRQDDICIRERLSVEGDRAFDGDHRRATTTGSSNAHQGAKESSTTILHIHQDPPRVPGAAVRKMPSSAREPSTAKASRSISQVMKLTEPSHMAAFIPLT